MIAYVSAMLAAGLVFLGGHGIGAKRTEASPQWKLLHSKLAPQASALDAMSEEPGARGVLLLDSSPSALGRLTWTLDGEDWKPARSKVSPALREGGALSLSADGVLLFSGLHSTPTTKLADSWIWNGEWRSIATTAAPPPRAFAAVAYDPRTKDVVLFGGLGRGFYSDTWIWNGKTWHEASGRMHPSSRYGAQMAWDPSSGDLVLYGGLGPRFKISTATWLWTGQGWRRDAQRLSPGERYNEAMASDPSLDGVVLFGGRWATPKGDLWLWKRGHWHRLVAPGAPSARTGASMSYDASLNGVVMFGGLLKDGSLTSQTWLLTSGNGTRVRSEK